MSARPFDVVVLSSVEWDAAWHRHQVFASQWARAGHRVFFVENTGFREPGLRDLSRLAGRLRRVLTPHIRHDRALPPGLQAVSPLVLPPTRMPFREANRGLLAPRLADQLRDLGLAEAPVVFAYLPTPTTLALIDELAPALVVYDCVDNFYGLPDAPVDLARTEAELMARSGLVLTTSRTLFEDKKTRHPRVMELHHGVSGSFFLPLRAPRPARRLAYFGTVWGALDFRAVAALALDGFAVDLIGPVKEAPPELPEGVRLLPAVPHDALPALLAGYDALLLPYADNEYNRGVIPAKTYECLATGLPVLATPLPALAALEELRGVLDFARAPEDWVAAARALGGETPEHAARRVAVAHAHEEHRVFARLRAAVEEALRAAPQAYARTVKKTSFLSGLGWIGLLYGAAKLSTLATQVLAGRWLGPEEYGRAGLVVAASAYLQILPTLGFPLALSKLLAAEPDEDRRARLVSTGLLAFLVWTTVTLPAMAATHRLLQRALGVPGDLFALSMLLAAATAVYTVTASPLLGLKRFAHRGLVEAAYGIAAPISFIIFWLWRGATHESFILALCASLLLATGYSLWPLRRYLRPRWEPALLGGVARYASVATLNLLAAACVLAPARMLLHRHASVEQAGLFNAYFTATMQVALALLYMIQSALVPLASDASGQREAWGAFKRWAAPSALAAFVFFLAAGGTALAAFGRRYAFEPTWLALFAAASALALVHGAASALLSARDFEGLVASVSGGLLVGAGNFALVSWLVPTSGVSGAAIALAGAYAAGLLLYAVYGAWRRVGS